MINVLTYDLLIDQILNLWRHSLYRQILDKLNGTLRPPLPPKSVMGKWRVLAFTHLHPWFGGEGAFLFHFILSKIVGLLNSDSRLNLFSFNEKPLPSWANLLENTRDHRLAVRIIWKQHPERGQGLTISGCNYKSSTFSSVILRSRVFVRLKFHISC